MGNRGLSPIIAHHSRILPRFFAQEDGTGTLDFVAAALLQRHLYGAMWVRRMLSVTLNRNRGLSPIILTGQRREAKPRGRPRKGDASQTASE